MELFANGLLKNKNALLLFVTQSFISIVDKILSIGLIWYVAKNLGAFHVPWFLTMAFLPHVFTSFMSARTIHRFGVLSVIRLSELFRFFVLLITFFILQFIPLSPSLLLMTIYSMTFLVGIGAGFFTPAILSAPPLLVPKDKIVGLNALIDSSFSLSMIIGASLAAILLNHISIKTLIGITSLIYLFCFFAQKYIIVIGKNDIEDELSPSANFRHTLSKYQDIKNLLTVFLLFNLVLTPLFVIIPWYVDKVYHGTASDLSLLEGSMGAGAFVMAIIVSTFSISVSENKRLPMISLIGIIFGILFGLFVITKTSLEGALCMALIGAISTFLNIQVLTYFQTHAHENDVPIIMTAVNIISTASMPLSFFVSGILLPLVDAKTFGLCCGLLSIMLSLSLPIFMKEKYS